MLSRLRKVSHSTRPCCAVLAVLLGSCAGQGDPPPADGPFATGLSASATLDSLAGADIETLCSASQRLQPRLSNCPSFGMLAAFNLAFAEGYDDGGALPTDRRVQRACSETRRQCEEALGDSVASESPVECADSIGRCSGTVEQFEACMNDFLSLVEVQVSSTPSCDELECATFPDSARQWLAVATAPTEDSLESCQAFFSTCPSAEPMLSPPPNESNALADLPPLICGK